MNILVTNKKKNTKKKKFWLALFISSLILPKMVRFGERRFPLLSHHAVLVTFLPPFPLYVCAGILWCTNGNPQALNTTGSWHLSLRPTLQPHPNNAILEPVAMMARTRKFWNHSAAAAAAAAALIWVSSAILFYCVLQMALRNSSPINHPSSSTSSSGTLNPSAIAI